MPRELKAVLFAAAGVLLAGLIFNFGAKLPIVEQAREGFNV